MTYHATTLKNLSEAINYIIKVKGEDTYVGIPIDYGEFVEFVTLSLAFVRTDGKIVSDDDNYQPKAGEFPIVLIS